MGRKKTYIINGNGKSITCLLCGLTSHNPHDVEYIYCGNCHIYHEDQKP